MVNLRSTTCLLLAGLGMLALPARADVAPPVHVLLPQDAPQAVSGEIYESVFEVRLTHQGLLQGFEIVGKGWEILEAELPREGFFTEPTVLWIPFRARPLDANEPIGLEVAYECQGAKQMFNLGPEAFAGRGRKHVAVSRGGSGLDPATMAPEAEAGTRSTRGGAIPLRVVGRIVYDRAGRDVDDDGDILDGPDILPIAGVGVDTIRVRLLDVDPIGSETIWSGVTTPYGYFDTGDMFWDDCDVTGCDDPDLVLEVEADTGVVDVTDNTIFEDTYIWATPEMEDFTGDYHDYGEVTPVNSGQMAALHIFNSIVRTHRFILDEAGYDVPKVQVEWPDESLGNAGAVYQAANVEIHVGSAKQWRESTLSHEYGHHFLNQFSITVPTDYCNFFCDGADPCTAGVLCEDSGHCPTCPENDHDAWNEGWPNWLADVVTRWMSVAFVNDDNSPYQPLWTRSQESVGDCCQDGTFYDGQALDVEAFAGAVLRDIEDDNFDIHGWTVDPDRVTRDMTCLGVDEIFDTVVALHPTTIEGFLDSFVSIYPEHTANVRFTAINVAPLIGAAIDLPADTQPLGPVISADSPSHPSGQGGFLPCVTVTWDAPADDVNGACDYSYDLDSVPAVTVDDVDDPIDSLGCRLSATLTADSIGDQYFGIKAAECGFGYTGGPAVFGPFEVLDCNATGVIDLCDISCFEQGDPDICTVAAGFCNVAGCGSSSDCQGNLVPDECDIAAGTSNDCNENGIPDECEAMKNWGGGSGSWNSPPGWIEGAIPANGDHVCIQDDHAAATVIYASGDVTVPILASDESLSLGGGGSRTLTLQEPSWVDGDLSLNSPNSIVQVDDRLDVGGLLVWTGSNNSTNAKLRGAGATHVSGGLSIPSGVVGLQDHDLVLEPGSTSLVLGRIDGTGTASLTIRPGATLDYQGTQHLIGGSQLNVEGTLTKSVFTGTSNIASAMQNDGLVHVQDGTLAFLNGSQTTGDILGDPLTTVTFGCGVHELTTSSNLAADRVSFTGGNCGARNIRGTYDVTALTSNISSSVVTFTNEANIVSYGTSLFLPSGTTTFNAVTGTTLIFDSITAGTVNFNSGDPIVTTDLMLSGGRVAGASPITVNGAFTWPAGSSMYPGGVVLSNGTFTMPPGTSQSTLYDRTLNLAGPSTFDAGLRLLGPAVLNNQAGGAMDLRIDGTVLVSAGTSFNNAGSLVKSAGGGTTAIQPTTTNTGVIEIRTGTLEFRNLTQNSGQVVLNGGDLAMFQISNPQPFHLAGGSLEGSGMVTGVVDNTGGSVEPGLSAGTLTMTHDYDQTAAGRLVAELGGTAPGAEYDQLILTGSATATLAGTLRVELIDGFVPDLGSTFDVVLAPSVVGIFDTLEPVGFPADRDVRIIDTSGKVRLEVYDPTCNGIVSGLPACPGAVCPVIAYSLGGDPELTFADPSACPAGGTLPGAVDFVQGQLSSLSIDTGIVRLGPAKGTACGTVLDAFLWDDGVPTAPGEPQYYLARPLGDSGFGQASGGEERVPLHDECP